MEIRKKIHCVIWKYTTYLQHTSILQIFANTMYPSHIQILEKVNYFISFKSWRERLMEKGLFAQSIQSFIVAHLKFIPEAQK